MGCVHSKCFKQSKNGCCRCSCSCNFPECTRCAHYYQVSSSSSSSSSSFRAREVNQPTPSAGRLSHVLTGASLGTVDVPSAGLRLHFSSLTHRGYYRRRPDRANQDALCLQTHLQGSPELHLFAVFDGHGEYGEECAQFVRDKLPRFLSLDARLAENPVAAFQAAFAATNVALHESEIDDTKSGTTAIAVLVRGGALFVANVGDSRAVAGVCERDRVVAEELSSDHTPFRRDEYERVRRCGAIVLSKGQVEGIKDPSVQSWGDKDSDDGDPPLLWVQNESNGWIAMTRSVGDLAAESSGVTAEPEVKEVKITENHRFFVIASDGVFDFLSSQAVVDMVSKFSDPRDACSAIVAESYKLWLENDIRTDDITTIVVQIKDLFKVSKFSDSRGACSAIVTDSYKLWLENYIRIDDIIAIVVQIEDLFKGSIDWLCSRITR